MPAITRLLLDDVWRALDGTPSATDRVDIVGQGDLPSAFPVTAMATASTAAAALAIDDYRGLDSGRQCRVEVDRRLASMWFGSAAKPVGWSIPPAWDAVAGDYRCRDGWIRLHTNAPAHRAAALAALGVPADRDAVAQAVARRDGDELETAIVVAGGCAARMRRIADWASHPHGQAVRQEPLVDRRTSRPIVGRPGDVRGGPDERAIDPARPLAGTRVLDLTRVLAGPVATRFLAAFGATVLRIDPPDWDEPALLPDTTLGKSCARLDLRTSAGLAHLESLLASADVILHGYRPGALDGLGIDAARRQALAPDIIDIHLDAWGWTGPWRGRRGFDSLVQMASGIAHAGRLWRGTDPSGGQDGPVPLPVQAIDHATGHLLAAATVLALKRRRASGLVGTTRCSLARTAWWLLDRRRPGRTMNDPDGSRLAPPSVADFEPVPETTGWGPVERLRPPVRIDGCPMRWSYPAMPLGSAAAQWP